MKCKLCGQYMAKDFSYLHFLLHYSFLMNIYKESYELQYDELDENVKKLLKMTFDGYLEEKHDRM
jgi:hypothetical protein